MKNRNSRLRTKIGGAIAAVGLVALGIVAPQLATAAPTLQDGDSVWVGPPLPSDGGGFAGAEVWAGDSATGPSDFVAWCIEHDVDVRTGALGEIGSFDDFLGVKPYFHDPAIQSKVVWVISHSYPTVTLEDLRIETGLPTLTLPEVTEATQYAVWTNTEYGQTIPTWQWDPTHTNIPALYHYLTDGADANAPATPPANPDITVNVTAPSGSQIGDSLVGPFVVNTNQPTVSVSTDSTFAIVDASGALVDTSAVTDGTELYLDVRGSDAAGTATITATAAGSSITGKIITTPETTGGDPNEAHSQTLILAAPAGATTTGSANVAWEAVPQPEITTELTDPADGDQTLPWTGGPAADRVIFSNLIPGVEYILRGELMRQSDGSSTGIMGTTTFTPTSASGSVIVNFDVPSGYEGETLVAYERLYAHPDEETPVAVHEDINDQPQTIIVEPAPAIGTTLVDSADDDQILGWNGGTLIDTVTFENLIPGVEYVVTGVLMDKATGFSTGITGTTTFTPTMPSGRVPVTFAVPIGYAGDVLVAYEELFESRDLETPIAEHKDINDAAQTVTVEEAPVVEEPAIGTSLVDSADDDHVLTAAGGTLVDTVAYQNLIPGVEYTITGELMLKGDGTATGITGSVTFQSLTADGSIEVEFEVPAGFAGEALVAYEELFESDNLATPVAEHKDLADAAQTVTVEEAPAPAIGTTLVDSADSDHVLGWNGGTVIDTIAYQNLTPGTEYTVTGELMLKGDGSATGITGTTTFTPTEADGTTTVTFTVPVGFGGEVLVAYEELFESADLTTPVAEHKDINDAAQTVTVEEPPVVEEPAIGTSLVDSADSDHVLGWNGGTVIDTVAYQNLTPGTEYTVTGELMLKGDGSATGITGTTTFTSTEADGTTTVTFTVPVGFGGEVLVAYEELFESADLTTPVAEHKDINDAAQTVTVEEPPVVEEPAIGTSLVDSADSDHVLPAAGGTLVDTIAYQNLTPGTQYTIAGELMLKDTGSATGITGTVTFTPSTADGSVEVEFTVPAGFAGEALVAYEKLFESADLTTSVAVHEDINDAAQTVTVEQPTTTTPTPTPTATPTETPTPTATPTSSTSVIPTITVKPAGPSGLPTTGMNVGPAPVIGAVVLLGIGAFVLIARRRANSQR
ncbi:VaFE repeat-containing surface-anchored protein [Microbacterium gorillae]|uniref:VaFE repeat-containing surface-anchored protein n=1 Tax=Microbacterium gorillae TaxID=1231063 RepID=UPI003D97B14C